MRVLLVYDLRLRKYEGSVELVKYTKPIYLDYNATTPVAPEVSEAMQPYFEEHFGNPSSSHTYGKVAREALNKAREQVAKLIGAEPNEIVFTSGGSESNNHAIIGTVLISLMHANNEVGTIEPIDAIGRFAEARGIIFHSDAAQSCGKIEVNVDRLNVDLLTLAGHN